MKKTIKRNNKGRIALLNSPYILNEPFFQRMPNLSLLYLTSYMKKEGLKAKIFNLDVVYKTNDIYYFGFDLQKLLKNLSAFKPQMIGITCPYSSRWPFTQRLTKIIKSLFKDIPIVIGGIHPTSFPKYCLSASEADYVVIGEGELTIVEIFKHVISGKKPYRIDGIAFKDGKKIIHNPKTKYITNLDKIPFPAYEEVDIKEYKKNCSEDRMSRFKGLYFSLITSRGCPNRCTFCNMYLLHGRCWRPRSPQNVISEITYLVKKYGVRQFAIMDDNFSLDKKRTLAILKEIIKRKLKIKLLTPNGLHIRTLDEEIIWYFKKAGAIEISVAIESGSEDIRNKVYNKNLTTKQILKVISLCKKHKLPCKAFFMVGAPGESDKTVKQTIDLMRRIKVLSYISIFMPYKGTKLYEKYFKKDIGEKDLQTGYFTTFRLPLEKKRNYSQIISWRRKMIIYNILYSWRDIIKDPELFNFNTLERLIRGLLFPIKPTKGLINFIVDKYLPLEINKIKQ